METLLKRIWNTNNLALNTSPKWKDMRISYIPINLGDMRSIAYIPKLCEIAFKEKNEGNYKCTLVRKGGD